MQKQRVMGFVIVRGGKIRLVGRDERQPWYRRDRSGRLRRGAPSRCRGAAARRRAGRRTGSRAGRSAKRERRLVGMDRQRDRTLRPSGQGDQVLGVPLQPFDLMCGPDEWGFQERPRVQPHQAAIAAFARCQQHDPGRPAAKRIARARVLVAEIDRKSQPMMGGCRSRRSCRKIPAPEHVVGIGQRQRRLAVRLGEFGQLLDLDRPSAANRPSGRGDGQIRHGHGRRRLLHGLERSSA